MNAIDTPPIEIVRKIREHLSIPGNVIQITTYLKSIIYKSKHREMFRVGKDGAPLVQRGKHWDNFGGARVSFGRIE